MRFSIRIHAENWWKKKSGEKTKKDSDWYAVLSRRENYQTMHVIEWIVFYECWSAVFDLFISVTLVVVVI